jgi:hypothetical protein
MPSIVFTDLKIVLNVNCICRHLEMNRIIVHFFVI